MTRLDFIDLMAKHAQALDLPLHDSGTLAGLPRAIDRTLDIADTLRELGQAAPSAQDIRGWYAVDRPELKGEGVKQVLECLARLRGSDLDGMDAGDLALFASACANWSRAAMQEIRERRYRDNVLEFSPA